MLLEVKSNCVQLTFYKNGTSQGMCYGDMPVAAYYPQCVLLRDQAQVTLNPNASPPALN